MDKESNKVPSLYQEMVVKMRTTADLVKSELLIEAVANTLNEESLASRLPQLKQLCYWVKFFPSSTVLDFLSNKVKLPNSITRWFVPLGMIETELKNLEAPGISVDWVRTIFMIEQHLNIKLDHEFALLFHTTYDDGVELSSLSKTVRLLKEREKRALVEGTLMRFKNEFERRMYSDLILVARRFSPEFESSIMLKHLNGKTEYDILADLEKKCLKKPESMSQRSFYIHLYGLLQLICKDTKRAWPADEDEWCDIRDIAGNWDQYRARKVEAYLTKK
ncbi:MAG: hypothetical protein EOO15_02975 [Chitinophagaceae bacterium]|nr:MAG: hypothetical protein EOO15_02975 [Chitinophagaceae bacterium]